MVTVTPLEITEGWYDVVGKNAHLVEGKKFVGCDMVIITGDYKHACLDVLLHLFSDCDWIQERDEKNVLKLYRINKKRPKYNFRNIKKINGAKARVYVASSSGHVVINKIRRIK